ncbi:MAG: hypothetical protein A2Y13_02310 [Planctomycetes bacterium GWC2_45_44]|nr:MAG: hypothetical protein A2Y13_02310 [Planctomycetes bacterium GWC2_45_44]
MALADHPDINQETKLRVQLLGHKLGYRNRAEQQKQFATNLEKHLPERFGFMLIGRKLQDEDRVAFLHALTVVSAQNGIRLEISALEPNKNSSELEDHVLTYAKGVDGLLLSGLVEHELLNKLRTAGVPYVVLGHSIEDPYETAVENEQLVLFDNIKMGRLATNYLLSLGHKRIGFICETIVKGLCNDLWLTGYKIAHIDKGLVPDPELIHVAGKVFAGGATAARAVHALANHPTAYVIPDARTACSFMQEMRANGIKIGPRDIVIGCVPEMEKRYDIEDYPVLIEDYDMMAKVAVRHLIELCTKPMPCRTEIAIPFVAKNFS